MVKRKAAERPENQGRQNKKQKKDSSLGKKDGKKQQGLENGRASAEAIEGTHLENGAPDAGATDAKTLQYKEKVLILCSRGTGAR